MKAACILIALAAALRVQSDAQLLAQDQNPVNQTQVTGYWVDSITGLMWAGKDNGKAVSWRKATQYCRNLRLAGYSDWRLPTLDELASLVDKQAPEEKKTGSAETFYINVGRHVRGSVSLTGDPWSSNRNYFFDFVNSKSSGDLPYFRNTKYALCVRSSRK